jgi:CRISPR-associated protein Cas1
MKRNYYIFTAGKLVRKDSTVFFLPTKTEASAPALAEVQADSQLPPSEICGGEEEVLTETLSDEQKEEEKENRRGDKKVIPIEDIEAFYIFSEVNFNSRFLNFLNKYRIPAHLFNYYGFYAGTYYPRDYLHSGFLLVKQVQHYLEPDKRLAIAKEFIEAAAFNIVKNLRYYNTRGQDLQDMIDTLETYRAGIAHAPNVPALMGIEGRIRQKYYESWNRIIKTQSEAFDFSKRTRQPPENAINALVSFGNSLVYTTVLGEIYRTQLNPTVAFLHEPGERRFSLSLDIAEIFKPLFTDRIIFNLVNHNTIQEKHFEKQLNFCYLKEEGRKIFTKEFDEKLTTTIQHRTLKRDVSYRRLIRMECYKLVKHLMGDAAYEGFKIWW